MVVTETGTLRRIRNWAEMTAGEKKTAYRRVTKRNRARLAKLKHAGSASVGASRAADNADTHAEDKGCRNSDDCCNPSDSCIRPRGAALHRCIGR